MIDQRPLLFVTSLITLFFSFLSPFSISYGSVAPSATFYLFWWVYLNAITRLECQHVTPTFFLVYFCNCFPIGWRFRHAPPSPFFPTTFFLFLKKEKRHSFASHIRKQAEPPVILYLLLHHRVRDRERIPYSTCVWQEGHTVHAFSLSQQQQGWPFVVYITTWVTIISNPPPPHQSQARGNHKYIQWAKTKFNIPFEKPRNEKWNSKHKIYYTFSFFFFSL